MNERLGQFMREENITAAKLAEILQIQPSSISHLLSGRNKPNFDFIARILRMFSELSPDWLINGDGSMYRNQNGSTVTNEERSENLVTNHNQIRLTNEIEGVTSNTNVTQSDLFTTPKQEEERLISTKNLPIVNIEEKHTDNVAENNVNQLYKPSEVEKIIVFYEDQTFSIYNQRKTL